MTAVHRLQPYLSTPQEIHVPEALESNLPALRSVIIMEESGQKYFVLNEETGERISNKALPLEEARNLLDKTLNESVGQRPKLVLKQYLIG
jgi:hypothetical protein